TWAEVGGIDLTVTQATASAARIQLDPSGRRLYVGLQDGTHQGGYFSDVNGNGHPSAGNTTASFLLEVATSDMSETSRMPLGTGDMQRRLVRIALGPDGRTIAALIGSPNNMTSNSELHVIDASSWTEQTISLGADVRGPGLAFDASGRYLVVG